MSDVVRALAYLQWTSLTGRVRQRLRRLRQPKYLVGAIAGAAYMYFFVFRHFIGMHGGRAASGFAQMPPEFRALLAPLAAVALLLVLASAWVLPSDRAALRFTEAETDFLFPAPISRTGLIHFSVLRAQLAIFVSVFLMSLLLRRGGAVGVNPLQYATALWLLLATVRLHFLGASFTRERLLDLGVRPLWRRVGVVALLVALALGLFAWARLQAPPPADARGIAGWVGGLLERGPAAIVLAPLRWIVAPLLATGVAAFAHAVPAALALLALHYAWVVRSQVSFEEASVTLARKRAETRSAMREGRFRFGRKAARARKAPFALAPRGPAATAFLWKGLIAAGPFWRLRTLAIASAAVLALTWWLGASPVRAPLLKVVGGVSLGIAAWATVTGPMLVHRGLRETLDRLDVLRAMPLRGWQIAFGQLLTPVAMLVPAQWLLLLAGALAFVGTPGLPWLTPALVGALGIAALLLAPAICLLMLCVPFAGVLLFPGWSAGGRGGGVDVMGQRLIFGGVYLVTLALSLVPAALVAALLLFLLRTFGGLPLAVGVAAIAASAVLGAEVTLLVRWLGHRIERFDVSTELR
jgi:hypothetical protein